MATDAPATLRLTKHEGAGNDFLVLVDVGGSVALGPDEIRNLCDRRRGVGADGVIRLGGPSDGAEIFMELHNADGGVAETSGNGLRCAAQAAVDAGLVRPPSFRVRTAAGVSTVDYEVLESSASARATVSMGPVRLVGEPRADPAGRPAQAVDVGNPHIVVRCDDPARIDLAAMAEKLAAEFDHGVNVEYVAPGPGAEELTMRVFERGVGETWACGSGSCAAAEAARAWGLVSRRVAVRNPGGTLDVVLGAHPDDSVLLGGPVRRVAEVVVDRRVFQ